MPAIEPLPCRTEGSHYQCSFLSLVDESRIIFKGLGPIGPLRRLVSSVPTSAKVGRPVLAAIGCVAERSRQWRCSTGHFFFPQRPLAKSRIAFAKWDDMSAVACEWPATLLIEALMRF